MTPRTLGFLLKDTAVLLAMKKRGFGVGKWNGVGGKLEPGETLAQAMIREAEEEIGVQVSELDPAGVINFYFPDKPEWDQDVHLFRIRHWTGEPIESEEMRPEWFPIENIPFTAMWSGDELWVPRVLAGETVRANLVFASTGDTVQKFEEL